MSFPVLAESTCCHEVKPHFKSSDGAREEEQIRVADDGRLQRRGTAMFSHD